MKPKIAQKEPYKVYLEENKKYFWCSCGESQNQPYCDGKHVGTEFLPLQYTPSKSGDFYLCGCKRTNTEPLCDGTHSNL
ncbi:CDGSH iron-sulfur domain-containing protein [uncultured Croceitalea sp.]|uniref:CDGSH iron-sulfur domain-containing protein n=1 Tax=uncultured Croceitalea sp. TaxID=1798908 RepID=UPI00374FD443